MIWFALLAALLVFPAAFADDLPAPKSKPELPAGKKETAAQLAERYKVRHVRSNGALLSIQAKASRSEKGEPTVVIECQIDYNGPRTPFTVLKPSLERPTVGAADQTMLYVYYPNPDGSGGQMRIESPQARAPGPPPRPSPADFVTSVRRKPVAGSFEVWLTDEAPPFKPHLRRFEPGETIYLQLYHAPTDRGADDPPPLDAWTGRLWSAPVPVAVK